MNQVGGIFTENELVTNLQALIDYLKGTNMEPEQALIVMAVLVETLQEKLQCELDWEMVSLLKSKVHHPLEPGTLQ